MFAGRTHEDRDRFRERFVEHDRRGCREHQIRLFRCSAAETSFRRRMRVLPVASSDRLTEQVGHGPFGRQFGRFADSLHHFVDERLLVPDAEDRIDRGLERRPPGGNQKREDQREDHARQENDAKLPKADTVIRVLTLLAHCHSPFMSEGYSASSVRCCFRRANSVGDRLSPTRNAPMSGYFHFGNS